MKPYGEVVKGASMHDRGKCDVCACSNRKLRIRRFLKRRARRAAKKDIAQQTDT